MAVVHGTKFERNTRTGMAKASCTCGWYFFGENIGQCQARAATHDFEWEEFEPQPVVTSPIVRVEQ